MLANNRIDWQDKLFELTKNPDLRAVDVPIILLRMRSKMSLGSMADAFGVSKAAVCEKVKKCKEQLII